MKVKPNISVNVDLDSDEIELLMQILEITKYAIDGNVTLVKENFSEERQKEIKEFIILLKKIQ